MSPCRGWPGRGQVNSQGSALDACREGSSIRGLLGCLGGTRSAQMHCDVFKLSANIVQLQASVMFLQDFACRSSQVVCEAQYLDVDSCSFSGSHFGQGDVKDKVTKLVKHDV